MVRVRLAVPDRTAAGRLPGLPVAWSAGRTLGSAMPTLRRCSGPAGEHDPVAGMTAALAPSTVAEIVDRAGRPDFDRWAEQVERCGHCARPVRLRGRIVRQGPDGERVAYSTDAEPDRVLLVRCRNRRASVCPSCSYEYAGDMWQLLYAGAAGGRKDVPESVRAHPLVFATLTAPGFGPVHTTRSDRAAGRGRCRPPRGRPALCGHGRPTWCTAVHTEDDPRLGQPICTDCYDYPAHVAFNWHAPELWRRFTITLRRTLARRAGLSPAEFGRRCRISFIKVAEYQRRAVVHFHALIRLDGAGEDYAPPQVPLDADDLADAIREAAAAVRLMVEAGARSAAGAAVPIVEAGTEHHQCRDTQQGPAHRPGVSGDEEVNPGPGDHDRHGEAHSPLDSRGHPPLPGPAGPVAAHEATLPATRAALFLRFGEQTDVQPVNGGPVGELTPERVAAYIAKYSTKSAEDFGLGDRRQTAAVLAGDGVSEHVYRIVRTCWQLGEHDTYAGLRRWVHMGGFRGHFASKSRRYSTTLGAIRRERSDYRRRQAVEHAREIGDADDTKTTLVVSQWEFAGLGYLTGGDAALALSAAARARERRAAARDAY